MLRNWINKGTVVCLYFILTTLKASRLFYSRVFDSYPTDNVCIVYTYTLFYFCICTSPIADFYVLYISSCSLYSRGDVLFHLKRFFPKRAVRGRKYIYILFDKIHDTPLNPTEGRPSKLCLHNISLQTFCIVLKWTVYVVRTRVFKAYSSLFWTQLRPECTPTDRYWNFKIFNVLHCGFFF